MTLWWVQDTLCPLSWTLGITLLRDENSKYARYAWTSCIGVFHSVWCFMGLSRHLRNSPSCYETFFSLCYFFIFNHSPLTLESGWVPCVSCLKEYGEGHSNSTERVRGGVRKFSQGATSASNIYNHQMYTVLAIFHLWCRVSRWSNASAKVFIYSVGCLVGQTQVQSITWSKSCVTSSPLYKVF